MPTRGDAGLPRAYSPSHLPGDKDAKFLLEFLRREFSSIAQGLEGMNYLPPQHSEPAKAREGQLVFADGTDWNPGTGKGVYVYQDAGWVKL